MVLNWCYNNVTYILIRYKSYSKTEHVAFFNVEGITVQSWHVLSIPKFRPFLPPHVFSRWCNETCGSLWKMWRGQNNNASPIHTKVRKISLHPFIVKTSSNETFSALLAICEGNPPVTGGFPSQRPVTRNIDVFFDLRLTKRLSKQSRRRWFETPLRSLWRHFNGMPGQPIVRDIPTISSNYTELLQSVSQLDLYHGYIITVTSRSQWSCGTLITGNSTVCSTSYSGWHQSTASQTLCELSRRRLHGYQTRVSRTPSPS